MTINQFCDAACRILNGIGDVPYGAYIMLAGAVVFLCYASWVLGEFLGGQR